MEFPFDKEQVGKNGNVVDSSVLEGGLCFNNDEIMLYPGDVLYLPRGYVHEATTEHNINDGVTGCYEPSFHITVAIATHDWCLSVLLAETVRHTLDNVTSFRKALPIGPCKEYESFASGESSMLGYEMKQQLDDAMDVIQRMVTPTLLEERLREKYRVHNAHACMHRQKLSMVHQNKKRKSTDGTNDCVGENAASSVTLRSIIRVSTPDERSSVLLDEGCLRGLTVREETMPILLKILGKLKSDTGLRAKVRDLCGLIETEHDEQVRTQLSMICEFTLLSFARCCVELGALAVVTE